MYYSEVSRSPDFDAPVLDPQFNDYWARALVTGDWTPPSNAADPDVRGAPYGRPPGYPYLLAGIYRVFGLDYRAPRWVQMGAGLLNTLLALLIARRSFGAAAGFVSGLLHAVYWGFVYFEGELNSPVFEISLLLMLILSLSAWARDRRAIWMFLGGLLLGTLALLRPNLLLLLPALFLWGVWIVTRQTPETRKALAGHLLLLACACALAVAPVVARNYRVGGGFFLISCYGGVNAHIGNNPEATGHAPPEIPGLQALTGMPSWNCFNYPQLVERLGRTLGEEEFTFADASRYFYRRAWQFVAENPVDFLRLTGRKALLFWGPAEISDSAVVSLARAESSILPWLPRFPWVLGLGTAGALLAVAGIRANRRQKSPDIAEPDEEGVVLLLAVALACFVSVLPFFVAARYRLPVMPVLLIFSAHFLVQWGRYGRERRWKRFALLTFVAACALGAAHVEVVPYQPDFSRWHVLRGIAHATAGRQAQAEIEFRRALAHDPANAQALVHLGYLLDVRGDRDGARGCYEKAVDADPDFALARNNLGHALQRDGDISGAELQYRQALAGDPYYARAGLNLGFLLLDAGRTDEAFTVLRRTVEMAPHSPEAYHGLARALVSAGRTEEARTVLREAFARLPGAPENHVLLGDLLRAQGEPERARAAYERALRLDSGNAAARAALEELGTP